MANDSSTTITMRAHSAMERWLLTEIGNRHGIRVISAETSFDEMGIDTLEFVELVMAAEESLGIELHDDIAMPCKTPAQLAAKMAEMMERGAQRA